MANYAQIAKQYGIPANLFAALIRQESGGRQSARSHSGAIGLTQLMPGTARGLGVNPYNAQQNLIGGAKYLSQQYKRFGRWDLALAAYNAGPGAVQSAHGVPRISETQNYVRNIMRMAGASNSMPISDTAMAPPVQQAQQQAPPGHPYSTFAQNLIASFHNGGSPDAMYGAIMQLRNTLAKAQQQRTPGPTHSVNGPEVIGGGNPMREMIQAQELAKRMGLGESQNFDLPGGVQKVHVPNSYHYQRYGGSNLGRATDVQGSPAKLAAYFKRLQGTHPTELFYDPMGYYIKNGRVVRGAIGGHGTHVHIAY